MIVIFVHCSANAKDNYSLKVSLKNQVIDVFHEDVLIKQIPCSTGVKFGSTPVGEFTTHSKKEKASWVEEDGSKISYYYITRFNNYISFHSLLEKNHVLVEEGKRLYKSKKTSSLGCIQRFEI